MHCHTEDLLNIWNKYSGEVTVSFNNGVLMEPNYERVIKSNSFKESESTQ